MNRNTIDRFVWGMVSGIGLVLIIGVCSVYVYTNFIRSIPTDLESTANYMIYTPPITYEVALEIAKKHNDGSQIDEISLEGEKGVLYWEVEFENDLFVAIDANKGVVLYTGNELDDSDDLIVDMPDYEEDAEERKLFQKQFEKVAKVQQGNDDYARDEEEGKNDTEKTAYDSEGDENDALEKLKQEFRGAELKALEEVYEQLDLYEEEEYEEEEYEEEEYEEEEYEEEEYEEEEYEEEEYEEEEYEEEEYEEEEYEEEEYEEEEYKEEDYEEEEYEEEDYEEEDYEEEDYEEEEYEEENDDDEDEEKEGER